MYKLGNRYKPVKRWILGSHYIEGVWVGYNESISEEHELMYTIRRISQTLEGVEEMITQTYDHKGEPRVMNRPKSLSFDDHKRLPTLRYVTEQDRGDAVVLGGFVDLSFAHKHESSPPHKMTGSMVYFKSDQPRRNTVAVKFSEDTNSEDIKAMLIMAKDLYNAQKNSGSL